MLNLDCFARVESFLFRKDTQHYASSEANLRRTTEATDLFEKMEKAIEIQWRAWGRYGKRKALSCVRRLGMFESDGI